MTIRKITNLKNGKQLLAWWANNKGRGRDNCSLAVVERGEARAAVSKKQTGVIAACRTCSWEGNVNLSRRVLREIGLTPADIDIAPRG